MDLFNQHDAVFSPDRKYRYVLFREWNSSLPAIAYIGLNPSKATEASNDNTITKVRKIAAHNGFGKLYMLNLFAIISPYPEVLQTTPDPLGDNNLYLKQHIDQADAVVCAWGNFKEAEERAKEVLRLIPESKRFCLHINQNGSPKHPLYCSDETIIIPYRIPEL